MSLGTGSPRGCPLTAQAQSCFHRLCCSQEDPGLFWDVPQAALSIPISPSLKGLTQFFKVDFSHPVSGLNLTSTREPGRTGIMITVI